MAFHFRCLKDPDFSNTVSTATNDSLSIQRTPTKIEMGSSSENQIQKHGESTEEIEKSVCILLLFLNVEYPNWLFIIIFLE